METGMTDGYVGMQVPNAPADSQGPSVMVGGSIAKREVQDDNALALRQSEVAGPSGAVAGGARLLEMDKDFWCPICMHTMRDAFLTACGHSFCYACITTHLHNKWNCPCCGQYLRHEQLFPNFLLNKLLRKVSAQQLLSSATPVEQLRLALEQGAEMSVKELDSLLLLLAEKRKKAEQEEAEVNMEILLEFLHRSRQQKQGELDQLREDLGFLSEDIALIERRRQELLASSREGATSKAGVHKLELGRPASSGGEAGISGAGVAVAKLLDRGVYGVTKEGGLSLDPSKVAATIAKKRKVFAQFEDLQDCYLQQRRKFVARISEQRGSSVEGAAGQPVALPEREEVGKGGSPRGELLRTYSQPRTGLDDFQGVLSAFTRFSKLRVIAELRHGDLFHSSNIVSSIEFDRDDELFATAGVSRRRIKVFEFATVVNEMADVHCPVVEMSTRSKLSCLSWNKFTKSQLASSDYEGIVTVWDVNTCQSVMEYEEHEKRAWSVDFSKTEPTRLVSGSDDGKVKLWCTRQESSVQNIDMKANICCVKFNPGSSNFVAVGSADHHIHYYDLRHTLQPLHVFSGHKKAVSYVKFISSTELASASTDSTLRLWDVSANCPIRTLRGHTNEKNFVGLSVNSEYIACGSESNEVFVYHKAMSKPAAVHPFGSPDPLTGEDSDDDSSHFISAVCWKSDSATMLAANSQGTIKVLVMAP